MAKNAGKPQFVSDWENGKPANTIAKDLGCRPKVLRRKLAKYYDPKYYSKKLITNDQLNELWNKHNLRTGGKTGGKVTVTGNGGPKESVASITGVKTVKKSKWGKCFEITHDYGFVETLTEKAAYNKYGTKVFDRYNTVTPSKTTKVHRVKPTCDCGDILCAAIQLVKKHGYTVEKA